MIMTSIIGNAQFVSRLIQFLRPGFARAVSIRLPEDPYDNSPNYCPLSDEPASTGTITQVNASSIGQGGGLDATPHQTITDDTMEFPFWQYIPSDVLPDLDPDFDFDRAVFDLSVRYGMTAGHTGRDAGPVLSVHRTRMIPDGPREVNVLRGSVEYSPLPSPQHITHHYPPSLPPTSPSSSSWSSALGPFSSAPSTSGYSSAIRTDELVSDDDTDDEMSDADSEEPEDASMDSEDVLIDANQSGPRRPFGTACNFCKIRKLKCRDSAGGPCGNCVMRGQPCLHTIKAKTWGRKPKKVSADESTSGTDAIKEDSKGKGVLCTSQRQKKEGDVVKAKRRAMRRNGKGKGRV